MNRISKFSLVLFFSGLAVCLASSLNTVVAWTPLEYQLGLLSSLPVLFYVGFLLLMLGTLLPIKKTDTEPLFILKLALAFGVFQGIPSLFLSNPYRPDTHFFIKLTSDLMSHFFIPISQSVEAYAQFPGGVLSVGFVERVTGISLFSLAQYFPMLFSAITLLYAYIFFRRLLRDEVSVRLVTFISMSGLIYMQYHMVPQGFALIPLLLLATALTYRSVEWRVIALLAVAFLTIAHPPTALFAILLIGLVSLCRLALPRLRITNQACKLTSLYPDETRNSSTNMFLFSVVLWFGWFVFIAHGFFADTVGVLANYFETEAGLLALKGREPYLSTFLWQLSESPYSLTTLIRTIIFFLTVFYSSLCLWVIFSKRNKIGTETISLAWIGAAYIFTAFWAMFSGLNLIDRGFLFLFLMAPLVAFEALPYLRRARWKHAIVLLVLILSLVQGSTLYRDSNQYIVPRQSLILPEFLELHVDRKLMGGYYIPCESGRHTLPFCGINSPLLKGETAIVVIDPYGKLWSYLVYRGSTNVEAIYAYYENGSKIYGNGVHELYLAEG